jgi:hypothetical protein
VLSDSRVEPGEPLGCRRRDDFADCHAVSSTHAEDTPRCGPGALDEGTDGRLATTGNSGCRGERIDHSSKNRTGPEDETSASHASPRGLTLS